MESCKTGRIKCSRAITVESTRAFLGERYFIIIWNDSFSEKQQWYDAHSIPRAVQAALGNAKEGKRKQYDKQAMEREHYKAVNHSAFISQCVQSPNKEL